MSAQKPPRKQKRRKRSYSMYSNMVSEKCWFYVQNTGLHVVTQLYNRNDQYAGTAQATVPWRMISRAVSMHRRVKAERAESAKRRKRRAEQPQGGE